MTLIGAFLINTIGGMNGAISMFYLPVTGDLGFSQAEFAGYVSFMGIASILVQPLLGRLLVRFRKYVRVICLIAGIVGLLLFFLSARCSRLHQFYIVGALLSLFIPFFGILLGVSVVSAWFEKYKSIAVSIVTMGTSIGTVIYSQIANHFIRAHSWRIGFVSLGISGFAAVFAAFLLISPAPDVLGLHPYGWEPEISKGSLLYGPTQKEALKLKGLWLLCISCLFCGIYVIGIQQSLAPMLQVDFGYSSEFAALMLSLFSILCCVGKLIMGVVYHRTGARISFIYAGVLLIISMLMILLLHSKTAVVVSMCVLGLGNMFGTVLISAYIQEMFGNREFSAILGTANLFFMLGSVAAPFLVGGIVDFSSSYRGAYAAFIIMIILNVGLNLISEKLLRKKGFPCTETLKGNGINGNAACH
ncbi:MAG: MFS transporter [Lachnospiraceae bacterium]|nr:MFS transporter [Lachnospiraceae bacterium]